MDDIAAMATAQEQVLGIFADAVLKLALHVQQEAMEAQDLDQKARLAGAFHRLGRGLRQTVALQAKLARDARAEAARSGPLPEPHTEPDDEPEPADPKTVAVRRRRDWLTRGVERCVWNEYEPAEEAGERNGESLLVDFEERLSDLMAEPDAFLALDPDHLLIELCKELGLEPPGFSPRPPPVPTAVPAASPEANGHDSS